MVAEERHLESNLKNIREDHLARYYKAREIVYGNVLDAACGCGYGTHIIAQSDKVDAAIGIDIGLECIDFANKFWNYQNKTFFLNRDLSKLSDINQEFD